jgi:hypothetical protein
MARYAPACCLFCHDAGREHDFQVRLGKKQRYHGCMEGKSYSAKMAMAKRDLAKEKKKADFTRRAKLFAKVKIKGNRRLCPICKEIWTVNYFACKQCHERLAVNYDIDGIVTFNSGCSKHVHTRGGAWAT